VPEPELLPTFLHLVQQAKFIRKSVTKQSYLRFEFARSTHKIIPLKFQPLSIEMIAVDNPEDAARQEIALK